MTSAAFSIGRVVNWRSDAPLEWRFIYTPGPMRVIGAYWQSGEPSAYAQVFGLTFSPGWIYEVEYQADGTIYYDPPLSLIYGTLTITKSIHAMWLE